MDWFQLTMFVVVGLLGGLVGAMVGLGGGVFIVPILTLFLQVPIHEAISTSIVAVIATSTAAAIGYVRDEFSNIRLGMVLETATTVGALAGGLAAAALNRSALSAVFALVLLVLAVCLVYRRTESEGRPELAVDPGTLGGQYFDPSLGRTIAYRVHGLRYGMLGSLVAGNISGLLGIGGGVIKVPVMTLAMGVPVKAAAATSNFMIGVTACASAYIYYSHGLVNPRVAVPVTVGVTIGALLGSRVAPRISGGYLTIGLAVILFALAVQMALVVFGISLR